MKDGKVEKKKGEIQRNRPLHNILEFGEISTPEQFMVVSGEYSPLEGEPDSYARIRALVDNNLLDFGLIQERLNEFIGRREPWLGKEIFLNDKLGYQEIKYEGIYQSLEGCLSGVNYGLSKKEGADSDTLLLEVFRLGLLVGEVNNKDVETEVSIKAKVHSNNERLWVPVMLDWLTEKISIESLKPYKGAYVLSVGNKLYANENAKSAMAYASKHCPGNKCPAVFSTEVGAVGWIRKNLKIAIAKRLKIEKKDSD